MHLREDVEKLKDSNRDADTKMAQTIKIILLALFLFTSVAHQISYTQCEKYEKDGVVIYYYIKENGSGYIENIGCV